MSTVSRGSKLQANKQAALFDKRSYRGSKQQSSSITPPSADQNPGQTLPAYYAYLSSGQYSQYTPDDYISDIKLFAGFIGTRPLNELTVTDLQQWIGELKKTMPPKTVSRKVSALGNYFRWLSDVEHVLSKNPAQSIRAERVMAPLPNILFENEAKRLLDTASSDPRAYLLVLLLLETGLKKSELLALTISDFDFSDQYQPVMILRHSGNKAFKDRKLKLPAMIVPVYNDYLVKYRVTDALFPYTPRLIEMILADTKAVAGIAKPVTASTLRDYFVVQGVKRGETLEALLEKIGLAKTSFDDARKKYGRLTREAL
jgi:site-specific recombinase XerD